MSRKRISNRTKLAAITMLHFGIPYTHAKLMTDDQINSLVHWHHSVHHVAQGQQTIVPDVDHFSNLEPMLIAAHREQTKRDRKVIAKIKRIRKHQHHRSAWIDHGETILAGIRLAARKRKLQSRGFDKTRKRKFGGGKVVFVR